MQSSVLQRLMKRFDPGCATVSRMISETLDHPLSPKQRWQLRVHTLFCLFCRRYKRQLLALRKLASTQASEVHCDTADLPGLSDIARERIRETLTSKTEN
ncbi:MAG: hypothetical protein Kow00100_18410 [Geothermobacteraceae bacterium]